MVIYIGRNEQLMRQKYGNDILVYEVPDTCTTVSGVHARLTIHANVWTLEDLHSTNGTYVRNENGEFEQCDNIGITPDSIIRFGVAGYMSHSCWASHIRTWAEANQAGDNDGKKNYFYEFSRLQQYAMEYNKAIEKQESINEIHGWIASFSGVIVMIILMCYLLLNDKKSIDMTQMMWRMFLTSSVPPVVKLFFAKDGKKLRTLRKRRAWLLKCPQCGQPLSDNDIENRWCIRCKAH